MPAVCVLGFLLYYLRKSVACPAIAKWRRIHLRFEFRSAGTGQGLPETRALRNEARPAITAKTNSNNNALLTAAIKLEADTVVVRPPACASSSSRQVRTVELAATPVAVPKIRIRLTSASAWPDRSAGTACTVASLLGAINSLTRHRTKLTSP